MKKLGILFMMLFMYAAFDINPVYKPIKRASINAGTEINMILAIKRVNHIRSLDY